MEKPFNHPSGHGSSFGSGFLSALYMQGMSCFPGGLSPSSTGRIALPPNPERTLSCSMASDFEPQPTLY